MDINLLTRLYHGYIGKKVDYKDPDFENKLEAELAKIKEHLLKEFEREPELTFEELKTIVDDAEESYETQVENGVERAGIPKPILTPLTAEEAKERKDNLKDAGEIVTNCVVNWIRNATLNDAAKENKTKTIDRVDSNFLNMHLKMKHDDFMALSKHERSNLFYDAIRKQMKITEKYCLEMNDKELLKNLKEDYNIVSFGAELQGNNLRDMAKRLDVEIHENIINRWKSDYQSIAVSIGGNITSRLCVMANPLSTEIQADQIEMINEYIDNTHILDLETEFNEKCEDNPKYNRAFIEFNDNNYVVAHDNAVKGNKSSIPQFRAYDKSAKGLSFEQVNKMYPSNNVKMNVDVVKDEINALKNFVIGKDNEPKFYNLEKDVKELNDDQLKEAILAGKVITIKCKDGLMYEIQGADKATGMIKNSIASKTMNLNLAKDSEVRDIVTGLHEEFNLAGLDGQDIPSKEYNEFERAMAKANRINFSTNGKAKDSFKIITNIGKSADKYYKMLKNSNRELSVSEIARMKTLREIKDRFALAANTLKLRNGALKIVKGKDEDEIVYSARDRRMATNIMNNKAVVKIDKTDANSLINSSKRAFRNIFKGATLESLSTKEQDLYDKYHSNNGEVPTANEQKILNNIDKRLSANMDNQKAFEALSLFKEVNEVHNARVLPKWYHFIDRYRYSKEAKYINSMKTELVNKGLTNEQLEAVKNQSVQNVIKEYNVSFEEKVDYKTEFDNTIQSNTLSDTLDKYLKEDTIIEEEPEMAEEAPVQENQVEEVEEEKVV